MGISKNFFTFLVVFVAGVSFWMGGRFLYTLHHYFLVSKVAPADVSRWEVEEFKPGKFVITATYAFQAGGRTIYEKFKFSKPVYQNEYLAQSLIEKWQTESWQVWYNLKNPRVAALQKIFPMKEGVYFALSLGVLLYFAWLSLYVKRMNSVD